MATFRIFKETALPGTLQANSVYIVAPAGSPDYVEVYVTGTSASVVKRLPTASDVQAMVSAAVSGLSSIEVVADITARNAITPTNGKMVLVLDASADPTVDSGAATYIYSTAQTAWVKIAEYESLDVQLTWSGLIGKPSSTPAQIDDAVANSHTHANKTQLDKIGEDGSGYLTYNSALPKTGWDSTAW